MNVPILFANGPALPFPDPQAPTSMIAAWGVALSLAVVCFGFLVFKKQVSDTKVYLLVLGGLSGLLLMCLIPNIDRMNSASSTFRSRENLKKIGYGAHAHVDKNERLLPAGATHDGDGKPLHGWQTALLPYIDPASLHKKIDMTVPWSHARNAEPMSQEVSILLNPHINERQQDGFGLSHYAGNSHVIGAKALKLTDIRDGTYNTLLFGEVTHDLRPWGEPMNCRDPAKGLMVEGGFATPRGDHVLFVFADGSVRSISPRINPEVLKALATPNGGESVKEEDWYK